MAGENYLPARSLFPAASVCFAPRIDRSSAELKAIGERAMAEFERELIRERVKAGLAHARSKGRIGGRSKVKRDRGKDAKAIKAMRAEGDSYNEIAGALGRSKADIYRVCMTLGCAPDPVTAAASRDKVLV